MANSNRESKYFDVTLPANASWVYQTLAVDETNEQYSGPNKVIIVNNSDYDIVCKVMSKSEGDATDRIGFVIHSGLSYAFDSNYYYRIGLKFKSVQSTTVDITVNCMSYLTVLIPD